MLFVFNKSLTFILVNLFVFQKGRLVCWRGKWRKLDTKMEENGTATAGLCPILFL